MTPLAILIGFLAAAGLLTLLRRAVERWLTRPDDVIGMRLGPTKEHRDDRREEP
jgi:hypothetical protein